MFPRLQGLMNNIFHSVTEKRFNDCRDRSIRIMMDRRTDDDTSSGENVEIDDIRVLVESSSVESVEESHRAQCSCRNCDQILSSFAECSICLEPIQTSGPCVCPLCEVFWCGKCSKSLKNCLWCEANLEPPVTPCPVLTWLVNNLMLPCRNSSRGCTELLLADNRVKHEESCKYDKMFCPITGNCDSFYFTELTEHLEYMHQVIAINSTKIRVLIESFQDKLKSTASRKTKYKMLLLHDKCAFIVKISMFKYIVGVEICRRRLGYLAEGSTQPKVSQYRASVDFQCTALARKTSIPIKNGTYGRNKAEVHFNDIAVIRNVQIVTIDVNIFKPEIGQAELSAV